MLYRIQNNNDTYLVEAESVDAAIAQVKDSIKDEAGSLKTVEALVTDEQAAVNAYRVAIENLEGKIPDESLNVLKAILKDENRHIENLQAVINGTVTEKNLEDSSIKDMHEVWHYETKAKAEAHAKELREMGHRFVQVYYEDGEWLVDLDD